MLLHWHRIRNQFSLLPVENLALESCPASSSRLSKATSLGNQAPQFPSLIVPAAKRLLLTLPSCPAAAAMEQNPPPALPRSRPGLRTTEPDVKPLFGLRRFQLNKVWQESLLGGCWHLPRKVGHPSLPPLPSWSDQDYQDCSCPLLKAEIGCKRIRSGLEIWLLEQFWSLEPAVKLWNSSCLSFSGIYTLLMLLPVIPAADALC